MLSAIGSLLVLGLLVTVLGALLLGVERWQRARDTVVARQIMLTDAIHAELGAVVSPVVERRGRRRWRVVFALPAERVREMARLIAITERVFPARAGTGDDVHIVFTRRTPAPPALAA